MTTFYFEKPGDEVAGALIGYRSEGRNQDAVPCIKLQTREGRVYEITAHQERLKAALVKAAPVKGDRIRIRYDGEAEKAAPGMSKTKLFTVEVRRPNSRPQGRSEGEDTSGEVPSENVPATGE